MERKNYKLGHVAPPSAVFAGYLLMLFGICTVYFSLTALFLFIIGATLSFTTGYFEIDTIKKYYRPHLRIMGFIKYGERIPFPEDPEFVVRKFKGSYAVSSLSNRISKSGISNYRIYLMSGRKKKLVALKDSEAEAQREVKIIQEIFAGKPGHDPVN